METEEGATVSLEVLLLSFACSAWIEKERIILGTAIWTCRYEYLRIMQTSLDTYFAWGTTAGEVFFPSFAK